MSSEPGNESFFCALRPIPRILSLRRQDYASQVQIGEPSRRKKISGCSHAPDANRDTTRSITSSYDSLNRVAVAETTSTHATSPTNCWGEAYFYDNFTTAGGAWGNLSTITSPSSAYTGCTGESLSVIVLNNNRLSGYGYDSPGNLNSGSGVSGISYNAENQLVAAAGVTYKYDGDGKRVQKSGGTLYWYGTSTDALDETDLAGNLSNEYVFFSGQRIARRDASNNVFYYFTDHLGTSRTIAEVPSGQSTATLCYDADFYPFGVERTPILNTCSQNYKFTTKERDSESLLDNFGARYDSSNVGRFMSPDPGNAGAKLPAPQTWNAYSYVANNPINAIDPDGLDCLVVDRVVPSIIRANSFNDNCGDKPTPLPVPAQIKPFCSSDFGDCTPHPSTGCTNAFESCTPGNVTGDSQPNLRASKSQGPGGDANDSQGGHDMFDALRCAGENDPSDPSCWGVKLTLKGGMFKWSWSLNDYATDKGKNFNLYESTVRAPLPSSDKWIGIVLVNGDPLDPNQLLDFKPIPVGLPTAHSYLCTGLTRLLGPYSRFQTLCR